MKTICISEELLTDYLEGRLSPGQRREVEIHLSLCDPCLDYIHAYRRVCSTLSISRADIVPTALTKRVIVGIDRLDAGSLLEKLAGQVKSLYLNYHYLLGPS